MKESPLPRRSCLFFVSQSHEHRKDFIFFFLSIASRLCRKTGVWKGKRVKTGPGMFGKKCTLLLFFHPRLTDGRVRVLSFFLVSFVSLIKYRSFVLTFSSQEIVMKIK